MDLSTFLNPKSIAVIGASREPQKVGFIVIKNLLELGFAGDIYPINPNADNIQNLTCYHDYASLPKTPDLAILAIPAPLVIESLKQLADKGTRNVVVFTAGFKEIGPEGLAIEQEITKLAKDRQLNLLGPNCLGFVNNFASCNATFAQTTKTMGPSRFISQSGAIASSIFDWCEASNLGFAQFITLGNKAVLNENDFLQHYLDSDQNPHQNLDQRDQPAHQAIGMYLESISDGVKFLDLCKKLSLQHPLFILKPGKSTAAAKAMQSHTGAIAGEDAVLDAALHQAGVIRCHGMEDFFDLAKMFSWLPAPLGDQVAIVSNAGGPGVISADIIAEVGLKFTSFDGQTQKELLEKLPRAASIANPVDVLGDALAQRYGDACDIVLAKDNVHALIAILTPQVMTQIEETAEYIASVAQRYQKPIVCCFIGGTNIEKGEVILNKHHIPSFRFPERAIQSLASMWNWQKWRQDVLNRTTQEYPTSLAIDKSIIDQASSQNKKALDCFEADKLLMLAGIVTPPTQAIASIDEAKSFVSQHNYPVVLKLSSAVLLHKTDIGGVVTGISDEYELTKAYTKITQALSKLDSQVALTTQIQIQKQVEKGVELIVGVKRDANFGPVLMFGAGGTMAELIADRNLFILPLSASHARKIIEGSKVFKLLNGFRGAPVYPIDKLIDLMLKLSSLAISEPRIAEIEINPVILTYNYTWAVDGKVVLMSA